MATGNRTVSQLIQDTFNELQSQLDEEKRLLTADEIGKTPLFLPERKEEDLEGVIKKLALQEGFEVIRVLGFGGMGAVVKATDTKLKRTVALKFLPPDIITDPKNAAELRSEAELASRIQNENVVHILSWHEVDNVPFFAMELVDGETLDQMVKRRGRLPVHEALRIVSEAAHGLEALHDSGIIHRDIKPQNIMISSDGRVKITDFGISRTTDAIAHESSKTNAIAGTPKFMAPEQARGEAATKHSDIYSLGATLYFMLTGRSPVDASSDIRAQIRSVRDGRLVPITNILPKLNRDVAKVVMRTLSLKQARRPWDMKAFREEIDRAYLSQTVRSNSPLRNLLQKHRTALIVALAVAGGLTIGLIAGREIAGRAYDYETVSVDSMLPMAREEARRLRLIVEYEPADAEAASLYRRLEDAISNRAAQRLTEIIPAAQRKIRRREAYLLVSNLAAAPGNRLQARAAEVLALCNAGPSAEADRALDEFQALWMEELRLVKQSQTADSPEPFDESML